MLPKIENRNSLKEEYLYPKIRYGIQNKENNFSKLKKLREFLENETMSHDAKLLESKKIYPIKKGSTVFSYSTICNENQLSYHKHSASNVSVLNARQNIVFPQISIQRHLSKVHPKKKLKQILNFCMYKKKNEMQSKLVQCKVL